MAGKGWQRGGFHAHAARGSPAGGSRRGGHRPGAEPDGAGPGHRQREREQADEQPPEDSRRGEGPEHHRHNSRREGQEQDRERSESRGGTEDGDGGEEEGEEESADEREPGEDYTEAESKDNYVLRRRWGPADNPEIFAALVQGGGVLACMFPNLNVAPFTAEVMDGQGFTMEHLAAIGVLCALRADRDQPALVRQQIIVEAIAPNLPVRQFLPQDEARAELERVLQDTVRLRDAGWFSDGVARLSETDLAGVYNKATGAWADNATLSAKLGLIYRLISHPECRERQRCLYGIFILLIAFATRGNLSNRKADRIMGELRQLMPTVVQMFQHTDVALTYQNFGHLIHENNAHLIMARWLREVPQAAIRLRVLLDLVARAIHLHPKFGWVIVRRLYPDQWQNVMLAFQEVDGRIYYGFRNDLGAVKAPRFWAITWIAHKLLTKLGDHELSGYRGITPDKRREGVIDKLIESYLAAMDDDTHIQGGETEEEQEAFVECQATVANHPSIAIEVASLEGHQGPRVPRYAQ